MRMSKIKFKKLQIHNFNSQYTELDGTIVAINNDNDICLIQGNIRYEIVLNA